MPLMLLIYRFLPLLLASLGLIGSARAQQPYQNKTSAPAPTTSLAKSIPPPHPTMQHYTGGTGNTSASASASASSSNAIAYAPGYARQNGVSTVAHNWKKNIVTTVFWIGEKSSANNPRSNIKSSWDTAWVKNYGGYDDPDKSQRTFDFCPKGFCPKQNPFYCALPYNDVASWNRTKPEARHMIPWFGSYFRQPGKTTLKGRWLAIHHNGKTCFAQWEDVGPFQTDDWSYVFGQSRPINQNNGGAGLDVSPAVRDFLGLRSGDRCHWRFAELHEVRPGPWKKYGDNNHFVATQEREREIEKAELQRLQKLRDEYLRNRK